MPSPVSIPAALWHEEVPFSPSLDAFAPGLALAVGAGERNGHPTPVAAVRYRMPDNVVRRYRGRVDPAVLLVAVGGGAVYAAPCLVHDAPPAVFDPTAGPAATSGQPSVGGFINADIAAQLGLPPAAARYLVFAWLDEWTSAVTTVDVPADASRVESPLRRAANATAALQVSANAPSAAGALDVADAGAGSVHATWNAATAATVVAFGYDLAQRAVRWQIAADARSPQARAGRAEIPAGAFVGASGAGTSAIAILAGGQVKSALAQRR